MHKYTKKRHRFYDDLVAFLSSITGLELALETQRKHIGKAFSPEERVIIQGSPRVTNLELVWYPYDALEAIYKSSWPTMITLDEQPFSGKPTKSFKITGGIRGIHSAMIQSAFVHYFETVRPQVEGKYGKVTTGWPSVWNFGRVIRNAFSHGGQIYFDNLKAATVNWQTLAYSPRDNSRQIMYKDMTPVEIIFLMEDMDTVV